MKRFLYIFVLFTFYFCLVKPVLAATPISDASATLKFKNKDIVEMVKKDLRPQKLAQFLAKYNSPLTAYAQDIVTLADKYEIDYRLVVAISGVESTFCKAIPYNSYNCWGWKNGKYAFHGYSNALETVSKMLATHYYSRGRDTPEAIGPIYAPPSPSWPWKVRFFMRLLEDDVSSTFLAKQFSI